MKFLHTGDIHLGKKPGSEFNSVLSERISSDERQLLLNIILYANENEIPYIFIAGDLFDTNKPEAGLVSFVVSCFERYFGKIFIVCGNHDYFSDNSVYDNTDFPENTYILKDCISQIETEDAVIYGCGFSAPHKNTDDFSGFYHEPGRKPGIMIVHTDFQKDSIYNPMSLSDTDGCGLAYIAAGHIHNKERAIKRGNTVISYCGAPQNLNFKETEDASVVVGEINENGVFLSEVSLYCHSYRNISVDISGCESSSDMHSLCVRTIMKEDPENSLINLSIDGSVSGFNPDISSLEESLAKICMYIKIINHI